MTSFDLNYFLKWFVTSECAQLTPLRPPPLPFSNAFRNHISLANQMPVFMLHSLSINFNANGIFTILFFGEWRMFFLLIQYRLSYKDCDWEWSTESVDISIHYLMNANHCCVYSVSKNIYAKNGIALIKKVPNSIQISLWSVSVFLAWPFLCDDRVTWLSIESNVII